MVTGHRKTPGTHARTHTPNAREGYPRVTVEEKWSISRGEEGEFFPAAEQQPPPLPPPTAPLSASPLCLPWADHSPPPLDSPPGHFATQFLKVPSRRREPVSGAIPAVTSDCRDTQISRTHGLLATQPTATRHRKTQIMLKPHICLHGGGGAIVITHADQHLEAAATEFCDLLGRCTGNNK